jgi:hypothetical protein
MHLYCRQADRVENIERKTERGREIPRLALLAAEREDLGKSLLLARCLGNEITMLNPCHGIFSAI